MIKTILAISISLFGMKFALSNDLTRNLTFEYENNVSVYLSMSAFNRDDHEIKKGNDENSSLLIDNKPFFGSDLQIPQYQLRKLSVKIKDRTINLNVSSMYDPWTVYEGQDFMQKQNISVSLYFKDAYLVRGRFSDGAGTYYAQWLIIDGGSVRTSLVNRELLGNLYHSIFKNQ